MALRLESILRLRSAPGRSHRAGWLWPFHHNHEQHPAPVPWPPDIFNGCGGLNPFLLSRQNEGSLPEARPRIISDNGPQFIAKDFKEFIRISGMTHVRTSPYYPQSNGKIERWHKSLKGECIRPGTPARARAALIQRYVDHYNTVRLHSAMGFVTPADMLAGRQKEIHAARDRKLEKARRQRQLRRQPAA